MLTNIINVDCFRRRRGEQPCFVARGRPGPHRREVRGQARRAIPTKAGDQALV